MIRDVSDLEVYNDSLKLLRKLYLLLKKLPKSEYDTVVQCKKCSKSIPANIAEGFAKRASELEFKRFLKIAIGSSDELITHLRTIAITTPYLLEETKEIASEYKIISKRLNKLQSVWISGTFR
jgi:four helix bundle protein